MDNKTFLVKTNGFTVEGTYLIVAPNEKEAENAYLQYRKKEIEHRNGYLKWESYKNAYEMKEIVEIPLAETKILHFDDGDR